MGEFGQSLKKERESRGVTLEAITLVTKVSHRHLVALEQDEFNLLPGGVINKGIVRSYARVVGLDEDEWLRRFQRAYESSGTVKADDAEWTRFAENASRGREAALGRRPEARLRWAGVAVLLALLAALGWFVWNYVHAKDASAAPAPAASHAPGPASSGDAP